MTETALRLAGNLDEIGADAVVLLSPQAYTYATGFRVPSHPLMRWRHAAALVDRTGLRGVVSVDMEKSTVELALPGVPLYEWKEFREDPMEALAKLISERLGEGNRRIGIEMDFIPAAAYERLTQLLPDVEWVACDAFLERSRASKTDSELALIRELVLKVDAALEGALKDSRAGDTEFEVGQRIINRLYSTGISEHRILIVASGERSWLPNVGPSERVIRPGEVVRVEVFGTQNGYQAGVARTAVVGEPSMELAADWARLSAARAAALAAIRPGANPREIYSIYTEALGDWKDRAIVFFGHGMGLDLHELPYISSMSEDTIEAGAIIGVEPFMMLPGRYGLQVKDVIAVTEDGYEMVSNRLDGGELFVIQD